MLENSEKLLIMNKGIKDFELELEKLKNKNAKFKFFASLKCYNFSDKQIFDNICRYCATIKSERCYHCKTCKLCVRKLDHHCFIINNCVGYNNYKIFLNMLCYAILTLMIICMGMVEGLKFYLGESEVENLYLIFILSFCAFIIYLFELDCLI